MAIIKEEWLIPIGCICLAASILLDRFVPGDGIVDFLIGVLTGISIVTIRMQTARSSPTLRLIRSNLIPGPGMKGPEHSINWGSSPMEI